MMYYGQFGWIFMVLFWALIVGLIVLVVRNAAGKGGASFGCCGGHGDSGHGGHEEKSSALDILEKRYAKGEISKKEFETIKKDITNS